ncbi:hypothetical protein FACS1894168_1710 [Deltaproteobacteria bacterium]|nr:hypothetical protein FACS1894168_1710 [Deltaproteobacteria bacterium]
MPDMLAPRTAIRQKVCSVLRAALPAWNEIIASEHVYDSLSVPLGMKRLPAVLVYTRDERLVDDDGHADPGLRQRVLELGVEIVTGSDVQTDFLCAAAEAIMDTNETLGNLVQGTQLKRVAVDRDSDGEKTVVAARMDFEVTYWTHPVLLNGLNFSIPEYPEGASAILGITPSVAEIEEDNGFSGSGLPLQILTSTAPFIGPEHEPCYEPATAS